jgi:23S rRNA G2445 N2-methylase RlmL
VFKIQEKAEVFITCPNKCQAYLETEISELGFEVKSSTISGVSIMGNLDDCILLNFQLRTAARVLYTLKKFDAEDKDSFYNGCMSIPWEDYLDISKTLTIQSITQHEQIDNTMYTNLLTKDAINDRFKSLGLPRLNSGKEAKEAVVFIYWVRNEATVYLDTSGESLAKHGYRKISFVAPLGENLAAGIIYSTKWKPGQHFINPMCGAGTLAIEAALMATKRANGLLRSNYSFMHFKGYDEKVYQDVREKAKKAALRSIDGKIIASDFSPEAIANAKRNAQTAGVDHLIEFELCNFEETSVPEGGGIVILNPPYGLRVGESKDLEPLYEQIGDFFKKKCKGKFGYVFTGNMELAKLIGLKASRRIEFYNATIECRNLEYELYEGTRRKDKSPA